MVSKEAKARRKSEQCRHYYELAKNKNTKTGKLKEGNSTNKFKLNSAEDSRIFDLHLVLLLKKNHKLHNFF